MQLAQILN